MNTLEYKTFIETIQNLAEKVCNKVLKDRNIESVIYGNISAVNVDGTFNVRIAGTPNSYNNILNKSNSTLKLGDTVLLKAVKDNVGNGYIALKMGATDTFLNTLGTTYDSKGNGIVANSSNVILNQTTLDLYNSLTGGSLHN